MTVERKAKPAGDRGCGAAEFERSWSCSRIAHDCRSRQAACGPSRPRAKSAWITSKGLAPRRESAGEVKERRKPARPWQSGENGGGLPTIGCGKCESACRDHGLAVRKHSPEEHLAMEGVSVRLIPVSLTRERVRRVWSSNLPGNREWRGRHETSEVTRTASSETTTLPWRGRPTRATRRRAAQKWRQDGSPCREEPKLDLRRQASGQPGSDCRKVVRRRAGEPLVENGASCPAHDALGSTCGVDAAKVACSVVEQFTGARVVSRLQKSVRSIFPELQTRGAARQTEGARGSTNLGLVPWTRPSREVRVKGCEGLART